MQIPFLSEIQSSNSILLAGAGGGFDVASGIPIYSYLRSLGKKVILANLSFTALDFTDSEEVIRGAYRVTESSLNVPYFPEKIILEWLKTEYSISEIYAFSNKLGVKPLTNAYQFIIDEHQIDTVILIDGGTDSLMFGDEYRVGTIVEDACSIIAVSQCSNIKKYLSAVGFGVEHIFDHYSCLENVAELTAEGAYLGAISLTKEMPEGKAYIDLANQLNLKISFHQSIVVNSIVSSLNGYYGDIHPTKRTKGSAQFISPLMTLFWFFKLDNIAAKIKFGPQIVESETMEDIALCVNDFRHKEAKRENRKIFLP